MSVKNKRVLLTGACGFIGSHLARRLIDEGAEVHILIKKDSNQFRLRDISKNIFSWHGDILDYQSICTCLSAARPYIIFHLAALLNVKRDPALIEPMIETNMNGTLNLLRAVISEEIGIESFVNTGSAEEYGNGPIPFIEDQREMPVSPYSASKVAGTHFCQMLHRSIGLPVVTLRPFLVFGPGQDNGMFIPSLIKHCLGGRDFSMTEGNQTREFTYVDDIVEAYILAAQCPRAHGEVINIGSGIEYRIRDVAERVVNKMGNPIRLLIGALPKRSGEAEHFFCRNEKAKELIGWSPKVDLDEGLERTIKWYRDNPMEI
jgi:UDP-glucose 4-epimerase